MNTFRKLSDYCVMGYTENDVNEFNDRVLLSDVQAEFLKLCCSDMTYRQIGEKMCKSQRTVQGYAKDLFSRLRVNSRQGLAMWAIKNNIHKL